MGAIFKDNTSIGNLLVQVRKESELSQVELAERAHVGQVNISRIENGQAIPNLATLAKLAKGMDKKLFIDFVE